MATLNYKGKTYFLNSSKPTDKAYQEFFAGGRKRATEEVDYFLAHRKHHAFHPQHLHNGFDDISFIRGFFADLTQPTEDKVRRAMLLQITDNTGEGPENKYALKAGGGSASDSIFSSSYSILIADPNTGFDKSVVLIKKYSTVFSEVLITAEEIQEMFELVATPKQARERDDQYAREVIRLLNTSMCSGKIRYSNKQEKVLTSTLLNEIIAKHKSLAPQDSYARAFDFFEERFTENMKTELVEDNPKINYTERNRLYNQGKLLHLNRLRKLFDLSDSKLLELTAAGRQVELFAA
jgi:hypothetical protein